MTARRRTLIASSAAAAVLLAACGNPREDARAELQRLRTALEQHATQHGRYPETLDPVKPDSPTNLRYRARDGGSVRLVHAGADGIQALARRGPWICTLSVDTLHGERVECTPLSSSSADAPAPAGNAATPLDSMLHAPSPAARSR